MATLALVYGRDRKQINIPDAWLGEVIRLPVRPVASEPGELIRRAVDQPIAAPRLRDLVQRQDRVAIIVDDITRKTPVKLILPQVLAELASAGVADEQISIVIALGSHRPMTQAELLAKLGAYATQLCVVNTSATASDAFVDLGVSALGIPALVHRAVAEADVRIGLGMITPHLDAGYSGGSKIVLPGVCSAVTVDAFHRASAFVAENQLGRVDAPLRRTLEQFVAERIPLHFIVNVVTTVTGELVACVAGDPIAAHRAGVDHAAGVFAAPVARRYPVVVANCHPYDMDLWQSIKGVWAGDLVTANGGALIMVTAAPEGNSNYTLLPDYIGQNPEQLQAAIEAGHTEDDKQAATGVMFGKLKQRVRLALVSAGLSRVDAERMGVAYFATVEDAVCEAVLSLPESERRGAVAVLPEGGVVLPVVSQIGG